MTVLLQTHTADVRHQRPDRAGLAALGFACPVSINGICLVSLYSQYLCGLALISAFVWSYHERLSQQLSALVTVALLSICLQWSPWPLLNAITQRRPENEAFARQPKARVG
jgi:hypothetical protein